MVRSLAALGVGRALSRYWEMVPVSVIRSLLKKMLLELAYDTASDNVRVAVIQVRFSRVFETTITETFARVGQFNLRGGGKD